MFDNVLTRIGAAVVISGIFFVVIMALLPITPFPEEMTAATQWLFQTLWSWDFMLPFSTLITCFLLIMMTELIFVSLKLAMWLKKHLTQQH